jgi:transposase InsO family protein
MGCCPIPITGRDCLTFIKRLMKTGRWFRKLPSPARGVQYCAYLFRETLHALCPTVRQSMSRKGNCWDNAVAESFFKTLKREPETWTANTGSRRKTRLIYPAAGMKFPSLYEPLLKPLGIEIQLHKLRSHVQSCLSCHPRVLAYNKAAPYLCRGAALYGISSFILATVSRS